MIYLDLDRTLFQTSRAGEIWDEIAQLYPEINAEKARGEYENYFVEFGGGLYYHDISKQLSDYGLDPVAVYESLLETDLDDGRFEFPGVKELVSLIVEKGEEVTVLTFGADDYQRFKVALCPSLQGIPVVTTLRPKYEFLENVESGGWVVDDKPIGDEISGLASFVQVSLEGIPVPTTTSWPVFYSLHEVTIFFADVLSEA